MKDFIDLHCHILPGIDDGARSIEETLAMLAQAKESGFRQIIATPHHHVHRGDATPEKILEVLHRVQEQCDEEKLEIRLHAGNELYYTHGLTDKLSEGMVLTMAGSKYALVEFSPGVPYADLRQAVLSVQQEGYFPILAHMERYECMVADWKRAGELYDMGVYLQINAGSIVGAAGRKVKKYTGRLLKEELLHFIGTDAHDTVQRSMQIEECVRYLEKKAGSRNTEKYLREHAEAVIAHQVL